MLPSVRDAGQLVQIRDCPGRSGTVGTYGTGRLYPCAREASKNKNDLQFFWDTSVDDKIRMKAVEVALRPPFVYFPGAAILSRI